MRLLMMTPRLRTVQMQQWMLFRLLEHQSPPRRQRRVTWRVWLRESLRIRERYRLLRQPLASGRVWTEVRTPLRVGRHPVGTCTSPSLWAMSIRRLSTSRCQDLTEVSFQDTRLLRENLVT